jgi:hypothetical protein
MTVFLAEANAHIQKLISVVKMVTVIERYTDEEKRSFVRFFFFFSFFFWQKDSM